MSTDVCFQIRVAFLYRSQQGNPQPIQILEEFGLLLDSNSLDG